MNALVYLDTDAFHRIGQTFRLRPLAADLHGKILLSPITALEVFSHLTVKRGDEVLDQIKQIRNWVNPNRAEVLPWPDAAISHLGFNIPVSDDSFTQQIQHAVDVCLEADSVIDVLDSASKLKKALDAVKDASAGQFKTLIDLYRREPLIGSRFDEVWIAGLTQRIRIPIDTRPRAQVASALSAYYHFEKEKLIVAGQNLNYDPYKHKNDLLDSEQLVYLGDPALHFLTCDGGFGRRTKNSSQHGRIHRISPRSFEDPHNMEEILRRITR